MRPEMKAMALALIVKLADFFTLSGHQLGGHIMDHPFCRLTELRLQMLRRVRIPRPIWISPNLSRKSTTALTEVFSGSFRELREVVIPHGLARPGRFYCRAREQDGARTRNRVERALKQIGCRDYDTKCSMAMRGSETPLGHKYLNSYFPRSRIGT